LWRGFQFVRQTMEVDDDIELQIQVGCFSKSCRTNTIPIVPGSFFFDISQAAQRKIAALQQEIGVLDGEAVEPQPGQGVMNNACN